MTKIYSLLRNRDADGKNCQGLDCMFWLLESFHDLTLKAPITTAADDIHKYFFIVLQSKQVLCFK